MNMAAIVGKVVFQKLILNINPKELRELHNYYF